MKLFLILAGCLAGIVLLAAMTFAALLVYRGLHRPKTPCGDLMGEPEFAPYLPRMREGVAWFYGMHPQTVWISSYDGLRLHAYLLRHPHPRCTVLCAHGYLDNGVRDFSCVLRFFYDSGCNILLPDMRACGKSGGVYMCFGAKERYDIADWARYASETFGPALPLFLDGISMGATGVLLASELGLPENTAGIIADCGFTSPYEICRKVLRQYLRLPAAPLLPFLDLATRCIAGFGLRDCSTVRAMAKNTEIPVLFAHGGQDDFVPPEMSVAAYEACRAERQLEISPKAGHGQAYLMETPRYQRLLTDFLNRHTVGMAKESNA